MIMTSNNAAEIFNLELQNYRRYSYLIQVCEEKIEKYENDAMNLKSPKTDRVGENTCTIEFDLLEILRLLDIEKTKAETYSEMQKWILDVINGMDNKTLRPDIVRIFLKGEDRRKVAGDRGVQYNLMNIQIRKAIAKAVKTNDIARYNKIRRQIDSFN